MIERQKTLLNYQRKSKVSEKLKFEEQEELNHKLALTKAVKEMKEQAKSEGLKNHKLTGKKTPFMVSIHYSQC